MKNEKKIKELLYGLEYLPTFWRMQFKKLIHKEIPKGVELNADGDLLDVAYKCLECKTELYVNKGAWKQNKMYCYNCGQRLK